MKKKGITAKGSILKDRICAVCGRKFDVKLEEKKNIGSASIAAVISRRELKNG